MKFDIRFMQIDFLKFDIFDFSIFFFENFFGSKKYFLGELRFFFGYSFDVKLSDLSIYDVFRAFGVRQI